MQHSPGHLKAFVSAAAPLLGTAQVSVRQDGSVVFHGVTDELYVQVWTPAAEEEQRVVSTFGVDLNLVNVALKSVRGQQDQVSIKQEQRSAEPRLSVVLDKSKRMGRQATHVPCLALSTSLKVDAAFDPKSVTAFDSVLLATNVRHHLQAHLSFSLYLKWRKKKDSGVWQQVLTLRSASSKDGKWGADMSTELVSSTHAAKPGDDLQQYLGTHSLTLFRQLCRFGLSKAGRHVAFQLDDRTLSMLFYNQESKQALNWRAFMKLGLVSQYPKVPLEPIHESVPEPPRKRVRGGDVAKHNFVPTDLEPEHYWGKIWCQPQQGFWLPSHEEPPIMPNQEHGLQVIEDHKLFCQHLWCSMSRGYRLVDGIVRTKSQFEEVVYAMKRSFGDVEAYLKRWSRENDMASL